VIACLLSGYDLATNCLMAAVFVWFFVCRMWCVWLVESTSFQPNTTAGATATGLGAHGATQLFFWSILAISLLILQSRCIWRESSNEFMIIMDYSWIPLCTFYYYFFLYSAFCLRCTGLEWTTLNGMVRTSTKILDLFVRLKTANCIKCGSQAWLTILNPMKAAPNHKVIHWSWIDFNS